MFKVNNKFKHVIAGWDSNNKTYGGVMLRLQIE